MGQSSATALKTNIESMKLFVVLSLASVAIGGMDYEIVQKWQKLKAMESCWGEENMKLVMVDMKKAIAKCSHEDAPELSLPPYRSAYRFTNTMINKGNDYEHINDMASMFAKMMHQMKNRNTFSPYSSMSSNSHHGDSKMDTMKMMMHQDIKNKVESNFGPMEDILQETQLTEHEFFPLVMQLLHGKEMDYMTGGM